MQETRHDDKEIFTDGASPEQVRAAFNNPLNKEVNVFAPGSLFKSKDGRIYEVDARGTRRRRKDLEEADFSLRG